MADLSKRTVRVVTAAEVAFGSRWQTPLAESSGVTQQLLALIAKGDRAVTDDTYRKVANALLKEADRARATGDKLDKLAGAMLRELEE